MLWSRTFAGSWLRRRRAKAWATLDHIPDREPLWRAILPESVYKKDGTIKPAFFRDRRGGYSCDIAAFSTPEESRRGYKSPPAWNPDDAGLVEFTASNVRSITCDVRHAPLNTAEIVNYSHAEFTRQLTATEENAMSKLAHVVIPAKGR
jgi:hypothetical protein